MIRKMSPGEVKQIRKLFPAYRDKVEAQRRAIDLRSPMRHSGGHRMGLRQHS